MTETQQTLNLTSNDYYDVPRVGRLYSFDASQMPQDEWEPFNLEGRKAVLDGVFGTIGLVEAFAINRSPEHPYRLGFAATFNPS